MATAIEYALMAGASYISTRDDVNQFPIPQGWAKVVNPDSYFRDPVSGFEAISFAKGTEIVISFAGTGPGWGDWIYGNTPLALGNLSDQLRQAADYYLQVKAGAPVGATISFTGHSLGGGLASLMAVLFGESAFTFDQAPFLNSAKTTIIADPITGGFVSRSVAIDLRAYLEGRASPDILAPLEAFIAASDPFNPNPIAADTLAAREARVTDINVQGEILSYLPFSRIGTQADIPQQNNMLIPQVDLHSQALLTAFLQSYQTAEANKALNDVTFKLADLLKMIFDDKLYYNEPNNIAPDAPVNLLEHLVRHEAGVRDPATGATTVVPDAMVTRFTADLWKLAQDGGMTMNDGNSNWISSGTNYVSKTLTAFAMQKYYEETDTSPGYNKELFSAITGGIQFDMADVSKKFQTAFDNNQKLNLRDAKGFDQYFKYYLGSTSNFTAAEQQLIQSLLPYMRDWYVQVGANGLAATDNQNRGAFMLGGNGTDALIGGSGADLLVGNAGADTLMGKAGNDTLLGGAGNDTYVYTTGDGLDTILDRDGQGSIVMDGATLAGGAQYGDNRVHRDADGHLYVDVGNGRLVIGGNILIEDQQAGELGLTMAGAVVDVDPIITLDINGDIVPTDTDLIKADIQADPDALWNPIGTAGPYQDSLFGSTGNDHIRSGELLDLVMAGAGDDWIEGGNGSDYLYGDSGDDLIEGGEGKEILIGKDGNDRLYANIKIDSATAIASGNNDTGSGQKGEWLAGGGGDDTLVAAADNDMLSGGAGKDLLIAGAGDDLIFGDADYIAQYFMSIPLQLRYRLELGGSFLDWNTISPDSFNWGYTDINNAVEFTSPVIGGPAPAGSGADVIYAGQGKDLVMSGGGNDVVFGEAGDDRLSGGEGNDILLGGDNNDTLWGGVGSDYLDGGDGADNIQGDGIDVMPSEGGDDIIIGGKGNDTLDGGAGRDTYIFNRGDGVDNIIETMASGNAVRFGDSISSSDIILRIGSLTVDLGSGDAIHIENFDQTDVFNSSSISSFEFADGSSITTSELLARGFDLDGTAGDDTLLGTNTTDRMNGFGGNDSLLGGQGNDIINGGAGNDQLQGSMGDDTLGGGRENDTLIGEAGNDVYVFNRGDGQDIIDNTDLLGATDTLRFGTDIADTDVIALQSGVDLYFKIKGITDDIAFFNYYGANTINGTTESDHKIDRVEFANGVVWDQAMIQSVVDRATNNHAPTVNTNLPVLETRAGNLFSYTVPVGTITDPDAWDSITYSVAMPDGSAVPAWLSFDASTGTLSGRSDPASVGSIQFMLWGTDNYGYSAGELVTLNIAPNHAPVLSVALADQAVANGLLNYTVSETAFADTDVGDVLSYSATLADGSALPDWLSFDPVAMAFSGSPISMGTTSVRVTATDAGNLSASDVFDIVVTAQNITINGTAGNDTLDGGLANDTLNGLAGNDMLNGIAGDDVLNGGADADTMRGGLGNDTYVVDSVADVITENINEGTDTVQSSVTYTLAANVENLTLTGATASNGTGNTLDNVLDGSTNTAVNTLTGGAGNDTYIVGTGDIVSETSTLATEIDTVQTAITYTLTANVENLTLTGATAINGTGNTLNNVLTGNGATNTLNGGTGADTMLGGLGNDIYVVDSIGDIVTETSSLATEIDTVQSSITYILGTNVENLTLTGTTAINGTGNAQNNTLTGNTADNVLNGGEGIDTLYGGDGNDQLDGGGNLAGDYYTNDKLYGGLGSDTYLFGRGSGYVTILESQTDVAGNVDTVRFGAGVNPGDVYLSQDTVVTNGVVTQANLIVQIRYPASTYSDNLIIKNFFATQDSQWKVEQFVFEDGTIWTPSSIAARFTGATQGNDTLRGFIWGDTIDGLGGSDVIYGNGGNDTLEGGSGNDTLYGDDYSSLLAGDDTLHGGAGNDSLIGGKGNDTYLFNRGDGQDTISDALGNDKILLGAGILTTDVTLFQDSGNLIIAVDGGLQTSLVVQSGAYTNNKIEQIVFADGPIWDAAMIQSRTIAGTPNAMVGTAGNDTFIVDNSGDTITEGVGQGTDTVQTSVSYLLPTNVENMTATGYLNLRLTGNALDNIMVGNSGNNVLDGGGMNMGYASDGTDTLIGGSGDDTYFVTPSMGDVVVEQANEGIDTVIANLSYTLPDNVENLYIRGNYNYMRIATGNALDNVIAGSGDADIIDGGAGADTMTNGGTFYVDNIGDQVWGPGIIRVFSSVDYALPEHAGGVYPTSSFLTLTGSNTIRGTGNGGANTLDGRQSSAANVLEGGAGNDTYWLGANDIIVEQANGGVDTLMAYADANSRVLHKLASNVENLILTTINDNYAVDLEGSEEANRLVGNAGVNTINGMGGDDQIEGGAGSDLLSGGAGNDVYVFNAGGGQDTIDNYDAVAGSVDTIRFGVGITPNNITFRRQGNNLVLGISGTADQLTILNWGLGADYQIKRVEFSDSTIWDAAALAEMTVNHAPTTTGVIANQSLLQEQTLTLDIGNLFSDADIVRGDSLIFGATQADGSALPSWLTFNSATHTLTGTPGNAEVGSLSLRVTATDSGGLTDSADFTVDVTNVNDAPVLSASLSAQKVTQDTLFSYSLPAGTFNDVDTIYGDSLSYTATLADGSQLPTWLTFDVSTQTFSGIPGSANIGNLGVKVIVTDTGGLTASGVFTLTVEAPIPTITGTAGNDSLIGTAVVEKLIGLGGNDTLNGGAGADIMLGGTGDDTYVVDNTGDVVVENANEGTDTVQSSITYTLGADLENLTLTGTSASNGTGNALNNILTGNSAANVLTGGAGDDTYVVSTGDTVIETANQGIDTVQSSITYSLAALTNIENLTLTGTTAINGTGNALDNILDGSLNTAVNALSGGTGNDTYILGTGDTVTEAANAGTDTVITSATYTLATNVENLTLTGAAAINGTGNSLNNVLTGNSAANTLSGGTGADTLIGGAGNDTYVVDNTLDAVTENLNEGTDLVQSSVTYTLADNLENLTLTGTTAINGTGNTLNNVLTGNSGANTLTGGAGNDLLDGGTGIDKLYGGTGDDTYVVDVTTDIVSENVNEGTDTVQSKVTYTLGANLESLTLTGTTAINGTGNTLNNVLTGNSAINTLTGGAGNDRLDGKAGADKMSGGTGDDTYVVDNTSDTVTENANEGIDTIESSVTYTLKANVEALLLTGSSAINGTDNTLSNLLIGNSGINTLTAGTGNDILQGGAGNDILKDTAGSNLLDGGAGADTLTGAAGNELFVGGTGNDTITTGNGYDVIAFNRGDGQDILNGGVGKDNTLSLGGGIQYADLALSKTGNDLILEVGGTDQITLKNWYDTSANYKSVLDLQVMADAMSAFDSASPDPLLNKAVQQFDFTAIANSFDAARGANATFMHWSALNTLLPAHLSGSDSAAFGGDLAHQYGKNGAFTGMNLAAAQGVINDPLFGAQAQTLHPLQGLQGGSVSLG